VRNVTVSLDDETAGWARVEAARRDQSLSRFVGELLRSEMHREQRLEESAVSYRLRRARNLKPSGSAYPTRDELHSR
jgi:hypothetical protein